MPFSPYLSFSRPRSGRKRRRSPGFPIAVAGLVAAVALVSLLNLQPEPVPEPVVPTPVPERPFPPVSVEAASAIVVDLATGKTLFAKDADTARPLASITKLVTAVVVHESLPPETRVVLAAATTETFDEEPFSVLDASGTPYTVTPPPVVRSVSATFSAKDLLSYTLVSSSNTGAEVLAKAATKPGDLPFAERMNDYARKIGMRNARFGNPTGLDEGAAASAVGSTRDIAVLLGYMLRVEPEVLAPTAKKQITVQTSAGPLTVVNTDAIAGKLPNLVGGKTGFTDTAGGNLAVIIDPGLNSPIAIVVLGSSKLGRFTDVETLAEATLAYLSPATSTAAQ